MEDGLKNFLQNKINQIRGRGLYKGNNEQIKTDIGYLTPENIEYLLTEQKLLAIVDDGYSIRNQPINDSTLSRPVQLYSLFLLVCDDITNSTGIRDLNTIIEVMRDGLTGSTQYPAVTSIARKGVNLANLLANKNRSGNRSKGFNI